VETKDLVTGLLGGLTRPLHIAIDGISQEHLTFRPKDACNSIAWLTWHLTRVQDRIVSSLMGQSQVWVSEGWHAKFGRPADESDAGMGHGPDEVQTIRPDGAQVLFDYYDAVFKRTEGYVNSLSSAELDRVVDPSNPEVTVGRRLQICIMDNIQHAGQAAYLRGLIEDRKVWPS
jgi:uncharacterized damage-inducible protein DinB